MFTSNIISKEVLKLFSTAGYKNEVPRNVTTLMVKGHIKLFGTYDFFPMNFTKAFLPRSQSFRDSTFT